MAEWLYARLLRLYPPEFRERYASEMSQLFRDRLRHENTVRVWIDVLSDVLVSIPRQHWIAHPYIPPTAAWLMPRRVIPNALFVGLSAGLLIVLGFLFSGPVASPLAAGGVVLLFVWAIACGRRVQRRIARSRADADDGTVTVRYEGLTPHTLQRCDIVSLRDYTGLGLRICTADAARDLWVPASSKSYPRIKALLSDWAPVQNVRHVPAVLNPSSLANIALNHGVVLFGSLHGVMGAVLVFIASADLLAVFKRDSRWRWLRLGPAVILAARWWLY